MVCSCESSTEAGPGTTSSETGNPGLEAVAQCRANGITVVAAGRRQAAGRFAEASAAGRMDDRTACHAHLPSCFRRRDTERGADEHPCPALGFLFLPEAFEVFADEFHSSVEGGEEP